jgi:EpsD family peptidyl-prolyl cis-trans isomerase
MDQVSIARLFRPRAGLFAAAAAAALLTGCGGAKPGGQVAATVNGEEVTLTELNAELAQVQAPKDADKKALQRQALQRVVERKLLADAAREDKLDQTPEFVIRKQQLEDALLVQLLTQKVARGLNTPAAADVDKFMSQNPDMFAQRTLYTLDQIRFPTPTNQDVFKQLAAAKTMPEVIALLDRQGIKYERGNGGLDTAQVPKPLLDQIRKVPAGEPFVVPAGNAVIISLITGSRSVPLGGPEARPLAANAAKNVKLGDQLRARLAAERAKAKIEYQSGFAPAAGETPGAGAGAAVK